MQPVVCHHAGISSRSEFTRIHDQVYFRRVFWMGLNLRGGGGRVGLISRGFKRNNKKEHFETSGY